MEKFSERFWPAADMPRPATVETERDREGKLFEELRYTVNALNAEEAQGLQYAVVGGVAMAAYREGDEYHPLRENQTARDLDLYILDDPNNRLAEVKKGLATKEKTENFELPVSFNSAKPEGYHSPAQLLGSLKKKADGLSIVFRDVERDLPNTLMARKTKEVMFQGISAQMRTFDPGVLLHLYITRIGSLKNKDLDKVSKFLKESPELREKSHESDAHRPYRVFHEFAHEVRRKYPVYSAAIQAYAAIDHAYFNSLISHKIIPEKLMQKLIDL